MLRQRKVSRRHQVSVSEDNETGIPLFGRSREGSEPVIKYGKIGGPHDCRPSSQSAHYEDARRGRAPGRIPVEREDIQ